MIVIVVANMLVIIAIAQQLSRRATAIRIFFWPSFFFKIFAGILLGVLYLHYYKQGDTLQYFADAKQLALLARTDLQKYVSFIWDNASDTAFLSNLTLQQPRSVFLSGIGSVFCLLTADSYWLVATWFSFISFAAAWLLVTELVKYKADLQFAAPTAFLIFPSVVFWTSGLMKESIAFAMICFIVAVFLRMRRRERAPLSWYVMLPPAFWILWSLKYYYVAVLLPVVSTELIYSYVFADRLAIRGKFFKGAIWASTFAVTILMVSGFHPNFDLRVILEVIVATHDQFVMISEPGEYIHFHRLQPDILSIVVNSPLALVSGIFRPFLWEVQGLPAFFAASENFVLTVLAVAWLSRVFRLNLSISREAALILVYSILLCILLALAAPNFGTLSRYRVGFLPFLVLLMSFRNPLLERLRDNLPKLVQ